MRRLKTEILVIGGGATGAGVLRDLAMRGFRAILVERRDLASGTTGRYHGLLHSGARYVCNDPTAARECIEENRTLRKIIPHCLEDTGGLFVSTPGDDPDYIPRFLDGCRTARIPVDEVPVGTMLREEPRLSPAIVRCFRVPDASADSFLATDLNARSAEGQGAEILRYHEVRRLIRQGDETPRIIGAVCVDLVSGEDVSIEADIVVNASGAWAGKIAATAGIAIPMRPGKGTMVAVNHRVVHSVINRCKLPADGDILVPAHTVSIIGTTDEAVSDPDASGIEPWEIPLMMEEGEKMIPGFRELRILRTWTGVRPLYQQSQSAHSRRITRAHVLIDHEAVDGVAGLITITGGKWTTYRLMAEVTVDKVCEKLGVARPCRTQLEALESVGHHSLGSRLHRVESGPLHDSLVCECELATYEEVKQAVVRGRAVTIDDVRRDTRLGMGPCQGSFCTYRIAGILEREAGNRVPDVNAAMHDFLEARWRGLRPVLSGPQLKQERLAELIYLNVLAIDSLPGPRTTRYATPAESLSTNAAGGRADAPSALAAKTASGRTAGDRLPAVRKTTFSSNCDVLVIGGGLAGMMTAWFAVQRGRSVRLITNGQSALMFSAGAIDVLGREPGSEGPVTDLPAALQRLVDRGGHHPYVLTGLNHLEASIAEFVRLCTAAGYPLLGSLASNSLLPTACGSLRPVCLVPESMAAGLIQKGGQAHFLIAGPTDFLDFFPSLVARNLQESGYEATFAAVELRWPSRRRFLHSKFFAQFLDDPDHRREFCNAVGSALSANPARPGARLGLPAFLGVSQTRMILEQLQSETGCPPFEIPGLPPSVPGFRLQKILTQALRDAGVDVLDGMEAIGFDHSDGRITTVLTEAASRSKAHRARQFVLATGGILSGGLRARSDGSVEEPVFGLPVGRNLEPTRPHFADPEGHPVFRTGVEVNSDFQPIDSDGRPCFANLFAVGSVLGGADPVRELSLEGIALATAHAVGVLL